MIQMPPPLGMTVTPQWKASSEPAGCFSGSRAYLYFLMKLAIASVASSVANLQVCNGTVTTLALHTLWWDIGLENTCS